MAFLFAHICAYDACMPFSRRLHAFYVYMRGWVLKIHMLVMWVAGTSAPCIAAFDFGGTLEDTGGNWHFGPRIFFAACPYRCCTTCKGNMHHIWLHYLPLSATLLTAGSKADVRARENLYHSDLCHVMSVLQKRLFTQYHFTARVSHSACSVASQSLA